MKNKINIGKFLSGSSSNLLDNSTTFENSLVIISKKEEYENDKYRLRRKFNFGKNPYTKSQPNMIIYNGSMMNLNSQSKKSLESQMISRDKINHQISELDDIEETFICPSEISMEEIPQSNRASSFFDSNIKTEKESKHMYTEDSYEVFVSKDESMKEPNLDEMNIIDKLNYLQENNKVQTENTSNESDNNSIKCNKGSPASETGININSNPNSVLFSKYNSSLMSNNNSFRLYPLFGKNCSYNISTRLLNDEMSHKVMNLPSIDDNRYKFITEITDSNIRDNENQIKREKVFEKLLQMNNDTFYYLMLFIYDDYSKIKSLNKKINNKIRECLISQHKPIITGFIEQYKSILEITSVRYQSIIQNDNNKVVPLFDLIITAKIKPSKQYYISHILGYNYRHIFSMKNNEYLNQFQFDIRPRSAHLIWFSSEVDEYCYSYTRFCYTQNISSFSYNDSIQFRINLMSPVGIVSTFKWNELQSDMNIPRELYEKNILKKETEFDRFRDCEIENIVHLWKNARHYLTDERHNKKCSPLMKHKILLHSFIEIMKSNFELINISYDESKEFYFKLRLRAIKTGIIQKNSFFNFIIHIVDKNSTIMNESRSIYQLNTSLMNPYQIRLGTVIVFYITDV